jgi:2-polyprenyl-6-methoxyphenol hydroxylase-like FAD-dependent oxidoreductase
MIITIAVVLLVFLVSLFLLKTRYANLNVLTGLDDLERLGKFPPNKNKKYKHAIVCGGSIAGLISARVLLDHFERVTIIDQDDILTLVKNDVPQPRNCVPQQYFTHAVHSLFTTAVENLFPGIGAYYVDQGAHPVDYGEWKWYFYTGWFVTRKIGKTLMVATRPLIEHGVRKFLYKSYSERITTLCGSVIGMIAEDGSDMVDGICVRLKNSDTETKIFGDFVVDATGKASKGVKWLKELGYEEPPYDEYDAFVSYAARVYKKPEISPKDEVMQPLAVLSHPHSGIARNGYVFETENKQILATFIGLSKEAPPSTNFEEWASGFPVPYLYDSIKHLEPVTSVRTLKAGKNRILFYDQVKTPSNFAAVGDALSNFNPTYGQGLSCAALGALTLDVAFRETDLKSLSQNYFNKMKWRLFITWNLPKALDQGYPNTSPKTPNLIMAVFKMMLLPVFKGACHSKLVSSKFFSFLSLSGSPLEFLDIFVLWDLVKCAFR